MKTTGTRRRAPATRPSIPAFEEWACRSAGPSEPSQRQISPRALRSSSGVRAKEPWSKHWALSAGEIRRYGSALVDEPDVCALLMWRYFEPDGKTGG